MYDELRLHQTYTDGDYFHLDIELKWLRGMRLHRGVRFKFFRHRDAAGLEFRSISEWPVMFQVWPGQLVDDFGPYFVISTGDADRKAIAQLDPEGLTLVSDIAAELFTIISSLTHNPAAEITDAKGLLREVIRVSDYIGHDACIFPAPQAYELLTTANVGGVSAGIEESTRPQLPTSTLQSIAAMLSQNQRLLKELLATVSNEKEFGVLESYLAKIRLDGVPKQADMKGKLEQLAENNTAMVALINAYATAGGELATADIPFLRNFPAAVEVESAI